MALPRISPYAALAGALWGDIVSVDTMLAGAAAALEKGNVTLASQYLFRAQACAAKGKSRNASQFEQPAPVADAEQVRAA